MSILCAFDFSPGSTRAATVAAGLAARLHQTLHLVHALPHWPEEISGQGREALLEGVRRGLESEAARLRLTGATVSAHLRLERPTHAVLELCDQFKGQLVVVGATGQSEPRGERLGRTADRLAQHARVPVLVVRELEPFQQWFDGSAPLSVMTGLDFDQGSEQAFRWATRLGQVAPIALSGVHVYWPPKEFHRLGLEGVRSYVDQDPEVERVLRLELSKRFDLAPAALELRAGFARASDHLSQAAGQRGAALVVVATHRKSSALRLWEGSVSHGVLREASCSVVCVPVVTGLAAKMPMLRTALAGTDFSPEGDAAVACAYATVGPEGKVVLAHVVPNRHDPLKPRDVLTTPSAEDPGEREVRRRLERCSQVHGRAAISTEILVLESDFPGKALAQAAERVGADLICVGTHQRSAAAQVLLGSNAQEVLRHTTRPVMFARAAAE